MLFTPATRRVVASSSRILLARPVPFRAATAVRFYENVTYSGGQATKGQGGFYGSAGARKDNDEGNCTHRPEMLALAADVQYITQVMDEVEVLQHSLEKEDSEITSQSIELRQTIKKLMTSFEFVEALDRLEIQGSPVWGLSSEERELIIHARELMNEC